MIAMYFLIIFWLIPVQIVMAVTAERIARAKGLSSGDHFLRTLFLGYPSLALLCESEAPAPIFQTALSRSLLRFVLILLGCPSLVLVVLLFSYCLPVQYQNLAGWVCLAMLGGWFALASIAVAACNIWLLRKRGVVTRREYALAGGGQAIYLMLLIDDLTRVESGLSENENSILRNLLIPCMVPLVIAQGIGALVALCLVFTYLIVQAKNGYVDFTVLLWFIALPPGALAALAVSPLLCYQLSLRKQRSATIWTPVGFALPIIAPLLLSLTKTPLPPEEENAVARDWIWLLAIHSQLLILFCTLFYVVHNLQGAPAFTEASAIMAILLAWSLLAILVPVGLWQIGCRRKLLGENRTVMLTLAGACGIQTVCLFATFFSMMIKYGLHASFL